MESETSASPEDRNCDLCGRTITGQERDTTWVAALATYMKLTGANRRLEEFYYHAECYPAGKAQLLLKLEALDGRTGADLVLDPRDPEGVISRPASQSVYMPQAMSGTNLFREYWWAWALAALGLSGGIIALGNAVWHTVFE